MTWLNKMEFFNPEERVLIRIKDCAHWGDMMKNHHGFLPTGTLMRAKKLYVGFHEYQEEKTLWKRAKVLHDPKFGGGGIYSSYSNWDTLQSGDTVSWVGMWHDCPEGSMYMLLGHVVLPWYAFKPRGNGALESRPMTLVTQVWQPLDIGGSLKGRVIAYTFRKDEGDVVLLGNEGLQTTDDFEASDEVMSGLAFEVVDRTFLGYQPEWVKAHVRDLENWNSKKKKKKDDC